MDCPPASETTRFWAVPAHHAASQPDAVALVYDGQTTTYAQLAVQIEQCAATLWHGWGVRPGGCVAWLGLNHPAQLVLLFALARIGAALLPLNFRLAPMEWSTQLQKCNASHLFHDEAWAAPATGLGQQCGVAVRPAAELDDAFDTARPDIAPPDALLPDFALSDAGAEDRPALLVYTSGTTGQPRAAVHTQSQLLANMRIAARAQQVTPRDHVLTVLPLFHVGGLCLQTLPALYAGASVTLHPRFNAGATLEALARDRPTLTLQVPATMQALVDHPAWQQTDLGSLRAVWAGSSVLPLALVRAFLGRGVPLCNVYGATETGPFSIALPPGSAATHAGSCGWPAPDVDVRLLDGELLVRGPNVVRSYVGGEPACDSEGWFHTGDLATQAADGSYTVVGRARDLIISGGENVHPLEIEHAIGEHPAVAGCAAFGLPHPKWGEAVAVAIVLRPGCELVPDALRQHLDGKLARFKLPRHVFFVDSLPTTALGKLQRSALRARFSDSG